MADFNMRSEDLGFLVVIGGPGGSGASTIAKKLAKHFSLNYLYGGQLMRDLAKQNGFVSLTDFLKSELFAKNQLEFDFLIDEQLFEKSFNKDVLIDSKVFAALATKHEIPCTVKIWIHANIEVRIERTVQKKLSKSKDLENMGVSKQKIRENLQKRFDYDAKRFNELYGVDFENQEKYNDILLDSSEETVQQTFDHILKLIEEGGYFKKSF